jgi:Calpain family cysteine protease/Bacterial pre-peptidase C-terminal domain
MFDNTLTTGSESNFNSSFDSNINNLNNILEASDLITPKSLANGIYTVGNTPIAIENYTFNSGDRENVFSTQTLQSVDNLTGQDLKTTLVDPGNSLDSARNLDSLTNTSQVVSDSINSNDLNDYYRFNLSSTSDLKLNLNGLNSNADLQLLDRNGKQIQTAKKTGTQAESINRKLNAGDYYVRVYADSNSTDYTLNLSSTIVDNSGNNLSNARDFGTVNGSKNASDYVGSSDPNDYYRFSVNDISSLNLRLNNLGANADIQLLDRNGTLIQESTSTGITAESLNRTLEAGTYYVRVLPNAEVNTNYSLNLKAKIVDNAGNTLNNARNIGTLSGTKSFSDGVSSADVDDYYRFTLNNTNNFSLNLSGLSANADIQLLDTNGNVIQRSSNISNSNDTLSTTLNSGTYYVRVYHNDTVRTDYTLNLTANPIDLAGNSLSEARNLGTLTGTQTVQDFVGSVDTNDYYRLTLDNSSNLSLTLNGMSANADVQLLDSNGNVMQSSLKTGTTTDSLSANLNGGNYYVRVYPNGSANTNYTLGLSATTQVQTDGAGNTLSNARLVGTLDGTQTFKDAVSTTDTNDYYRFTLNKNSDFSLTVNGLSGDADVQLLNSSGTVVKTSQNGGTTSESIAMNLNAGDYFVRVYPFSSANTNYNLSLNATPVITPTPDAITETWYGQNLKDVEIRNLTQSLASDGQLSRNDAIAILRDAKDGAVINADELTDLRTIVANATGLNLQNHVRVLTNKVVNGNVANQKYQGQTLGNLFAGSSDAQMENLINKWFLGSDRPTTSYTYQAVSGSLYQNGISADDIKQGQVGDCYYLATLSSIALEKPSYIQDMFIDNGDNTFTVRFFNSGVADYLTVDRFLPTSKGNLVYASQGRSATNTGNELWVALAEKAYAQLAESGWSRGSGASNSYSAIEGGWMDTVMEQVTGLGTSGNSITGMTKQQLIDLANSNKLLAAGFVDGAGYGIVDAHAYTITGYDSAKDKFCLRNPWGFNNSVSGADISGANVYLTWEQLMSLKAQVQWTTV